MKFAMNFINSKRLVIVFLVLIIVLAIFLYVQQSNNENKKTVYVNAEVSNIEKLSNTKIGWGIKRNDNHMQPDLGNKNKELIEKYNGICMGNKDKKYIYLTFDLGYEAGYTEKILEILKQNDVNATFFITGHYINTASDIVKRMIDDGHIIREPFSQQPNA